ncbi:MAG: condensin subunit MukF [Polyangiaceae bacterium]
MSPDPRRVLSFLAAEKPALELSTLDLAFLAALHLRMTSRGAPALEEDQLGDVFEQVVAILEPEQAQAGTAARRGTHAIRRLREQRLLVRVDGRGVVRAGEFALSRLAVGIVDFFLEEESLTRESLTLLTRTLLSSLTEIAHAAALARTAEEWQAGVGVPLHVLVGDLTRGIERRQRGFDAHQAEVQREIATLLSAEWFGAVEKSQRLLEDMSSVLRDLTEVLLRDTQEAHGRLTTLQDLLGGHPDPLPSVELALRDAIEQVDRVAAWGSSRLRAWSEFYQYVHRYLRDVIRLDPSRILTQRLRDQLAGRLGRPFALTLAAAPPIRLLRAVAPPPPAERPVVRRPRKQRETDPEDTQAVDPDAALAARVRAAVAAGHAHLSAVTSAVLEELPTNERFAAAGRVAQSLTTVCEPDAAAERAWVGAGDGLVIEEWSVRNASSTAPPQGEPAP